MPAEGSCSPGIPTKCPTCGRVYVNAQRDAAFRAGGSSLTCHRCGRVIDAAGPERFELEYRVRRNKERLRLEAAEVRKRPRAERRAEELRRACAATASEHQRWLKRLDKLQREAAQEQERARRERERAELQRVREEAIAERERLCAHAWQDEAHVRTGRLVPTLVQLQPTALPSGSSQRRELGTARNPGLFAVALRLLNKGGNWLLDQIALTVLAMQQLEQNTSTRSVGEQPQLPRVEHPLLRVLIVAGICFSCLAIAGSI